MSKVYIGLLWLFVGLSAEVHGQKVEQTGWLMLSYQQKLSRHWQLSADVQLRSANQLEFLENILARPGIGYIISEKQTATLGYTYFVTREKQNDETAITTEHRIFEQFAYKQTGERATFNHRLRLEQRFLEKDNSGIFAQRLRYMFRLKVPFKSGNSKKGIFYALQNETFLNAQNRDKINGNYFDQNRAYLGLGFTFSDQYELEAGYLLLYQIKEEINSRKHIFQLTLNTSL